MKRVFLIALLSFAGLASAVAQEEVNYLEKAYQALNQGIKEGDWREIGNAMRIYDAYKEYTNKTDIRFEKLLEDYLGKNEWKKDCHTVNIGDGYILAVQKPEVSQYPLKWNEADMRSKANRKGGFSDWRLPTKEELLIIFTNIDWPSELLESADGSHYYYWTSVNGIVGIDVGSFYSVSTTATCRYFIVRKYKL